MQVTVDLPENLAVKLQSNQNRLEQILELGLREYEASSSIGYKGVADILEFFAGLPTPAQIIELRPSADLQSKIDELLEKNRGDELNDAEERIWASYEFIEHLVRIAKAKARYRLSQ